MASFEFIMASSSPETLINNMRLSDLEFMYKRHALVYDSSKPIEELKRALKDFFSSESERVFSFSYRALHNMLARQNTKEDATFIVIRNTEF